MAVRVVPSASGSGTSPALGGGRTAPGVLPGCCRPEHLPALAAAPFHLTKRPGLPARLQARLGQETHCFSSCFISVAFCVWEVKTLSLRSGNTGLSFKKKKVTGLFVCLFFKFIFLKKNSSKVVRSGDAGPNKLGLQEPGLLRRSASGLARFHPFTRGWDSAPPLPSSVSDLTPRRLKALSLLADLSKS